MTPRTLKTATLALAALAGLSLTAPALAGPGDGPRGGRMLERLDSNGDGAVDQAEIKQMRQTLFQRLDADADGRVTKQEAQVAMDDAQARREERRQRDQADGPLMMAGPRLAGMLWQADTDNDGQVTEAEFLAAPMPMLERLDDNGDGRITADELPRRGQR